MFGGLRGGNPQDCLPAVVDLPGLLLAHTHSCVDQLAPALAEAEAFLVLLFIQHQVHVEVATLAAFGLAVRAPDAARIAAHALSARVNVFSFLTHYAAIQEPKAEVPHAC